MRLSLGVAVERVRKVKWAGRAEDDISIFNIQDVVKRIGEKKLIQNITDEDISYLINSFRKLGFKHATINRKLSALSVVLDHAVSQGWLLRRPKTPRLNENGGNIRFLTQEEEEQILQYTALYADYVFRDAFIVLVDTGVRPKILFRMRPKDFLQVSENGPTIQVWESPAGLPHGIPLTTRAAEVIARRLGGEKIFPELNQQRLERHWQRMKEKAGFLNDALFTLNMLRDTTACRLVQRGAPLNVVKLWMGHKSISVTMKYAYLAPALTMT